MTKKAARELAKQVLRRIPVVTLIIVGIDSAKSGVPNAIENSVIPVDLIQSVADEGGRKFDAWLKKQEKDFRCNQCRNAGLDPEDMQ